MSRAILTPESYALPAGKDPVPGGWATKIVVSTLISLRNAAMGMPLDPERVRSEQSGVYKSPFKGRGVEFAESRPYQAGDEVRHIDWRVTARTGRLHTKIFHEDRERAILVWVDLRRAMFFATRGTFKAVLAARAAAFIAWGAVLHGDRLGGLLFSEDDHRETRPFRGDRAALRLIGLMAGFSAEQQEGAAACTKTEQIMEESLIRLRRVTRPGSQLFLFSDFVQCGEKEEIHLAQLARHNDVVVMFFYDFLERSLPTPGYYPVRIGHNRSPHTHKGSRREVQYFLNSHSAQQRRAYQARFQKRWDYLSDFCRQNRIIFLPCSTESDSVALLQHVFGMRTH